MRKDGRREEWKSSESEIEKRAVKRDLGRREAVVSEAKAARNGIKEETWFQKNRATTKVRDSEKDLYRTHYSFA